MNIRKFLSRFRTTTAEQAIQKAAILEGEHTVATVMHTFYQEQLKTLDPLDDAKREHWTYAEVKEKMLNAFDDMGRYAREVDEARARASAIQQAQEKNRDRLA